MSAHTHIFLVPLAQNEKVTSAEFNAFDDAQVDSISKTGDTIGGTTVITFQDTASLVFSGSSTLTTTGTSFVTIGGHGMNINGHTIVGSGVTFLFDTGSTALMNGSTFFNGATTISGATTLSAGTTLTVGGTTAYQSGSAITLATGTTINGHFTGTVHVSSTGSLDFDSGSNLTCSDGSNVTIDNTSDPTKYQQAAWGSFFTNQSKATSNNFGNGAVFDQIASNSGQSWVLNHANGAVNTSTTFTVPALVTLELKPHNGAAIAQVVVSFRVGNAHAGGTPQFMPTLNVIRKNVLTGVEDTLNSGGPLVIPTPGSGAAWYAANAVQTVTYTANQNFTCDTANFTYYLVVFDEYGTNAETGNAWLGAQTSFVISTYQWGN